MAVRDKAALKAQISALIDSAGTPRISAMNLRSVLDDMADSFDFEAAAVGQFLIQRITAELGQADWQNASPGGTGVTLAQAIAAVVIDNTAVDHIRMSRADSATQVTLGLESVAVHTMTRYAAASPDNVFSNAEWLAGNTSDTAEIEFPATTAAHFKGFAIPATEASLTSIQQIGNPFDERDSYLPQVGDADVLVDIGGQAHKTYIAMASDFGGFAVDYTLR